MTFKVPKALLNLVTAAKFTSNTSPATTEFVKASGLLFAGTRAVSDTDTLTASDAGKFIRVAGTPGNIILNLPLASSIPDGETFDIKNSSTNNVTVTCAGSDTLSMSASTVTTSVLGPGDTIVLMSNGVSSYSVEGGSVQLRYAKVFEASLAASGYQRLPSGLILQWGSSGSITTTPSTVNFPISFPTACIHVNVQDQATASTSTSLHGVNNLTTTGFSCVAGSADGGNMFWFAIGY